MASADGGQKKVAVAASKLTRSLAGLTLENSAEAFFVAEASQRSDLFERHSRFPQQLFHSCQSGGSDLFVGCTVELAAEVALQLATRKRRELSDIVDVNALAGVFPDESTNSGNLSIFSHKARPKGDITWDGAAIEPTGKPAPPTNAAEEKVG